MVKILLLGRTGQLGSDIVRNLPSGVDLVAPGRDVVDVSDRARTREFIQSIRPDVVINTTAFHDVPLCESKYEEAFEINCFALHTIANACGDVGARLVTFSTDYVFDGTKQLPYVETDCPKPLQIYGITRMTGERIVSVVLPDAALIIRTCGLYGIAGSKARDRNFVDKRIRDAGRGGSINMSCEQTVCPTYTEDLSKAVLTLVLDKRAASGIYHLVNEGSCSWYEFTKEIYKLLDLEVDLRPVDRNGCSDGIRRPINSVLENTKGREIGVILPHWRDALKRYLEQKHGTSGKHSRGQW